MLLLLRRFAEYLVYGAVAGFVALVLVPVVIGWRPYTVLTGSMRPGIQPGDVVIDKPVLVSSVHVGEVVTFSDPSRHHELVTHRIRSIARVGDLTNVETRGDANNTSEHWTIPTNGRVGLVKYRLPKVGHLAVIVRSRYGILLALVVPIVLLAVGALVKIWKEDEDQPEAEGGAGDGDQPDDDPSPGAPDDEVATPRESAAVAPTVPQPAAQDPSHPASAAADR